MIGAGCVIDSPIPSDTVVRLEQRLIKEEVRHAEHSRCAYWYSAVMDRGGAETMMMNYLRHFDREQVTYDFLVNRDYHAAYEDEIEALGGRIYRMCPMYPQYFGRYKA